MTAVPQHLVALTRANQIKSARTILRHRIAAGEVAVTGVLLQNPEEIATMTVFDLLCWQHRWGEHRARDLLDTIPMLESKQVGKLTDRQRTALVFELEHERGGGAA